jgi:hypothetical protein
MPHDINKPSNNGSCKEMIGLCVHYDGTICHIATVVHDDPEAHHYPNLNYVAVISYNVGYSAQHKRKLVHHSPINTRGGQLAYKSLIVNTDLCRPRLFS